MIDNGEITLRLMLIPGILLGFVLHEFAHALMADRLGDSTPRSQGRITLDPRAHIDIIGFILILIVQFGWAKPVMTNPRNYKKPRRDDILVSLAGPCANLVLAAIFLLTVKVLSFTSLAAEGNQVGYITIMTLINSAHINVVLFVLNLLPLPMLDGYHVLTNIFDAWKYRIFNILEQYGMFIFILLAVSRVLNIILDPPVTAIFDFLTRLIL